MTMRPKEESVAIAASYTIPGPTMDPDTVKRLWKNYKQKTEKRGWFVPWRLEKQKRGAIHFHCLVYIPVKVVDGYDEGVSGLKLRNRAEEMAKLAWHETLRWLGPQHWKHPHVLKDRRGVEYGTVDSVDTLMALPGADSYSAQCQAQVDGEVSFMRYMQDHITKSKQEQIVVGFGRHWGIVGEKNNGVIVYPDEVVELTIQEYYKVIRILHRLATPMIRCDKAPFGRKKGFRIRRGTRGRSDWFSNPETLRRIIKCVVDQREAIDVPAA